MVGRGLGPYMTGLDRFCTSKMYVPRSVVCNLKSYELQKLPSFPRI